MEKISYSDFLERIRDPNISDSDMASYVVVVPGEKGLDFEIRANPELVEMTQTETELESALKIGNGAARLYRYSAFHNSLSNHPDRPVIVSEGDSWFQFPFLIKETIDHLLNRYSILSLGAAGDTLDNIVHSPQRRKGFEFLTQLLKHKTRVQAFMFSAAGNDVIGNDPNSGEPMVTGLICQFNGNTSDIKGHINRPAVKARLSKLDDGYRKMVDLVHGVPELADLPILIHGYDVPYAFPAHPNDARDPKHADKDQWLGRAFSAKGIMDANLRRAILKVLIDDLYAMLERVAKDVGGGNVHVVDCRGSLPNLEDWIDEIHGTSIGFSSVSRRFDKVLQQVLQPKTTP